jgi:thymidylate synthase ThyX
MSYACRVECDSVSPAGKRLTTFVVTYPRFVHSEMLTHRMFSRNSSSSRAIPIETMIEAVLRDPVIPVEWGLNQKGMQAQAAAEALLASDMQRVWTSARDSAVDHAEALLQAGLHKQIVNRLLEPWMWITVVITATEWTNFFRLRCHPDAQPEIRKIAEMMFVARQESKPVLRIRHLPFHEPLLDVDMFEQDLPKICAARCARVSYLTHDGHRDPLRDLELATHLTTSGHWSPFEHVATAEPNRDERCGNFFGWWQLRAELDPNYLHEVGE